MLALAPFVITAFLAILTSRQPVGMWGYPLWSFLPVAALLWFDFAPRSVQLRRFAAGFITVFVAMLLGYAASETLEPLVRDRPKATQFPGRLLAETVTKQWREEFGTPLRYVGGGEFATNNIAVFSPDRPHVIVHADPALSPWIKSEDLRRHGAVLVWEESQLRLAPMDRLRATYPHFQMREPLALPRQTWLKRGSVRPVRVHVAFVPPQS